MAKKRGQLRLVSSHDPASIFDDLDALRQASKTAATAEASSSFQARRRPHSSETFARIPHDRGLALARKNLSGAAWVLLILIDWLIIRSYGRNPVKLFPKERTQAGLSRWAQDRGLLQLEKAGVIAVERKRGRSPLITHLWYPLAEG